MKENLIRELVIVGKNRDMGFINDLQFYTQVRDVLQNYEYAPLMDVCDTLNSKLAEIELNRDAMFQDLMDGNQPDADTIVVTQKLMGDVNAIVLSLYCFIG